MINILLTNCAVYNIFIAEIMICKEMSPMGQEEVSQIKSFSASECNLKLWKPNIKDASASRKLPVYFK